MATNEVTAVELKQRLNEMSQQMKEFSQGLRSMYAENAISNAQSLESCRNVRDAVRRDATVFVSHLLPVTSMVVLNLSSYFDNYLGLNFEDWQKFIKDIVEDLESHQNACQLLIQMTESLIVSLKKREDEAKISVKEMENLTARLEEEMDRLKNEAAEMEKKAKECKEEERDIRFKTALESMRASVFGAALAIPTFGISLAVGSAAADEVEKMGKGLVADLQKEKNKLLCEARLAKAQVVSEKKQAEDATRAANITKEKLIPVVGKFLKGLEVWNTFFNQTKGELIKMSDKGQTALQKQNTSQNMERYYKLMKTNAAKINASCDCFNGALREVSMNPVSTTHTV
jgi:hypothetical protein